MNEQLTWEDIQREALALEISIDESDGHVFLHKRGSGTCGWFGRSMAGCEAAFAWLKQMRHAMEVRDQLRGMEPPRRRRMLLRYLWRR
jgi:hypothetical protein